MLRHGDVIVEKIDALPDGLIPLKRRELAYGEVTGHAHRIDVGDLFEAKDGQLYLRVDRLAHLSHEEHKTLTVEPGCYRVTIKRQYAAVGGWERVAD